MNRDDRRFLGALAVAWSQLSDASEGHAMDALVVDLLRGSWVYALPVPICSALGGTLIAKWFGKYDESAAIGSNFLFANVLLIPATLLILYMRSELAFGGQVLAIGLMIVGTIINSSKVKPSLPVAIFCAIECRARGFRVYVENVLATP